MTLNAGPEHKARILCGIPELRGEVPISLCKGRAGDAKTSPLDWAFTEESFTASTRGLGPRSFMHIWKSPAISPRWTGE
jgi:hypothetical protein